MSFLSVVKHTTSKSLASALLGTLLVADIGLGLTAATAGLSLSSSQVWADDDVNPALWKLTDADSEIWLFGTVHALEKGLDWRTDKINNAFDAATTFYMEAPVNEATPESMAPMMQEYGINHSGKPFYEDLSPQGRDYFLKTLKSLGISKSAVKNFAPMRPWLAAVTLATFQMQAKGIDPEAGVDKVLWDAAKAEGKKLRYLETLDQQFSIFGNLSPQEDLDFFEGSVQQLVEDTDMLDQLFSFWKKGEIDDLANLMNASFGDDEKMKSALLTNRNLNWAYQIDSMMKGSGKIFIAVGAGHLGGDKSVQHFLKQQGYEAVRQ
ncbi:TraB/GumN family protein [Kiloniella antarctica]|uniref:TraB/GumN family protein n=1 Tax=Kiloniella antarctica TaxID=1550907 RepID=A0ABW5BJK2_9PROT